MSNLENFTFEDMTVGQSADYSKTLTDQDIQLFAAASGDVNPVHLDDEFAAGTMFKQRIAHGMWTGGLISAAIAMELPGPGSIYLGQTLSFLKPVVLGDEITVTLTVKEKIEDGKKRVVVLDCVAVNQKGKAVVKGEAKVMPPAEKMSIPRPAMPTISAG